MLADRALALMPICASYQSKRREVLLRAKLFDFRERSALACGLVLVLRVTNAFRSHGKLQAIRWVENLERIHARQY